MSSSTKQSPEVSEVKKSLQPHPPRKVMRPEGQCEGPGCKNIVPSGWVSHQQRRYLCSKLCKGRYDIVHTKKLRGYCGQCGKEVRKRGISRSKDAQIFCNQEHRVLHYNDRAWGKENAFRPLVEEYIRTNTYYSKGTLPTVKVSLSNFFSFVFQEEGLTKLEDIRPGVVRRFIVHERARGVTTGNFIGHISTFFKLLLAEDRVDMANPVLPRIHSQRSAPTEPRPYKDKDLAFIWNIVEGGDSIALKLAFAIGKECGLRVGEVCNIRLEDIDQDRQTIFVRLPTKNRRTRSVPYHADVAKYLELWLPQRSLKCDHDHLLHSKQFAAFTTETMGRYFKTLLGQHSFPASEFVFHRLRHTWATRLMNGGMELAVLKVLGGWVSWNSMQKYIKVLDSTVQQQHAECYLKLQEQDQTEAEETMSLLDFALINKDDAATPMKTAA